MKIRELQKYVCANAAYTPELPEANGKKVAIIGAGPSGLACAAMLSRKGYCVEVFDKEKEASGIIAKEIPNYRIDPVIVKKDLDELFCDRITVHHNVEVSMSEIQNDFSKKYDAVYVGVGLARDRNTGITVEGSSENVYACSKFLT
ncbi:MAG: NAD(P)-binding protein, partial [Oscillospiraceae bacterium]